MLNSGKIDSTMENAILWDVYGQVLDTFCLKNLLFTHQIYIFFKDNQIQEYELHFDMKPVRDIKKRNHEFTNSRIESAV